MPSRQRWKARFTQILRDTRNATFMLTACPLYLRLILVSGAIRHGCVTSVANFLVGISMIFRAHLERGDGVALTLLTYVPRWPSRWVGAVVFASILLLVGNARAVPVNDTGVTNCRNHTTGIDEACNLGVHGAQDATLGRDRAAATSGSGLVKTGAGVAGFDFTKISNAGNAVAATTNLGSNSGDWACARDNVTGLTWDVPPTSGGGVRNVNYVYTWYSTDTATNGGNAGTVSDGSCQVAGFCDTEKYVAGVNALSPPLCGAAGWRMPTVDELLSIVHFGTAAPAIDASYFPSTSGNAYWAGTSSARATTHAWTVNFTDGSAGAIDKNTPYRVRLVRGN